MESIEQIEEARQLLEENVRDVLRMTFWGYDGDTEKNAIDKGIRDLRELGIL